ncbi:hypothetical protein SAMN05444162_2681 [Paenibacillaceae bacterium GAS479]|nr:hypothetical protein SAMN05444162_2681 [Paenibacillaceae bacterium GAS479]
MALLRKYIYLLIPLFFLYLLHQTINIAQGSDDVFFSSVKEPFWDWIRIRYDTWTSRLFSETLFYFILGYGVNIWRFLNPLFIILLAYLVVRVLKKTVDTKDVFFSLIIIGCFSKSILSASFFWITGSLVYLWPITIALVTAIPYADKLFRDEDTVNDRNYFLFFILSILVCLSNEQATFCLLAFSLIFHIKMFLDKRKQDIRLISLSIVYTLGTAFIITSPGNKLRKVSEIQTWFPEFSQLSLKEHLYIGFIWIFDKIFNEMLVLIMIISVLLMFIGFKHRGGEGESKLLIAFSAMFIVILSVKISVFNPKVLSDFTNIKNFNFFETILSPAQWTKAFFQALIPYLFWSFYVMIMATLVYRCVKHKIFILFLMLAAFAAMAIMFFSPTIYASGNRILAVSAVILTLIIVKIKNDQDIEFSKPILLILAVFPVINILELGFWWTENGIYRILY